MQLELGEYGNCKLPTQNEKFLVPFILLTQILSRKHLAFTSIYIKKCMKMYFRAKVINQPATNNIISTATLFLIFNPFFTLFSISQSENRIKLSSPNENEIHLKCILNIFYLQRKQFQTEQQTSILPCF